MSCAGRPITNSEALLFQHLITHLELSDLVRASNLLSSSTDTIIKDTNCSSSILQVPEDRYVLIARKAYLISQLEKVTLSLILIQFSLDVQLPLEDPLKNEGLSDRNNYRKCA